MANMTITNFFVLLGAPLRNPMWSWGAINPKTQDVVFRVWTDETEIFHGKCHYRLTLHKKWEIMSPRKRNGYEERKRHIEHAQKYGRVFFVYCHTGDLDAVPRKIGGYNENSIGVCESIIQDDANDFWGEETRILTIDKYHRFVGR